MADISSLINSPVPSVNEAAAANQAGKSSEQEDQQQQQEASVDEDGDQDVSNLDGTNDKKGKKVADPSVSVFVHCDVSLG